jgi:L-threonylcarbamoyladenylate synthase
VLKQGGLVIFPSDTVYGLLVDATNEEAVKKLIAFKNRPPGKAISVFVTERFLNEHVTVNDSQQKLLEKLLPGPFTVILDSQHNVSKLLESEKGTLGIRIPDYELVQELVKAFGKPITATSANLGGRPPHYAVETLLKELPESKKQLIDLFVDAGKLPRNKPSTIVDLTTPQLKILRQGDVLLKDQQTFITDTPIQTRKTAQYILKKALESHKDKPIVFILEGDLGSGKTVFVKGLAEYFVSNLCHLL